MDPIQSLPRPGSRGAAELAGDNPNPQDPNPPSGKHARPAPVFSAPPRPRVSWFGSDPIPDQGRVSREDAKLAKIRSQSQGHNIPPRKTSPTPRRFFREFAASRELVWIRSNPPTKAGLTRSRGARGGQAQSPGPNSPSAQTRPPRTGFLRASAPPRELVWIQPIPRPSPGSRGAAELAVDEPNPKTQLTLRANSLASQRFSPRSPRLRVRRFGSPPTAATQQDPGH